MINDIIQQECFWTVCSPTFDKWPRRGMYIKKGSLAKREDIDQLGYLDSPYVGIGLASFAQTLV